MNLTNLALRAFCLSALLLAAPAATPSLAAPVTAAREVKLFVVALDDAGAAGQPIGCNDSLVSFTRAIPPTRAPLRAALEELLKLPRETGPGGRWYNALHQSRLRLRSVSMRRGEATVRLTGRLTTGGACDAPRVRAQIEATATQFPSVRRVRVLVNSQPLARYLSER